MDDALKGDGQVQLDPTIDFVAGTISGMASLAVGFPFDTVKVRFQSPTIASRYTSTFSAIRTIVREEKFTGLYRGITSPMATVALMNGLVFASYRFLMKLQLETADSMPTLNQIALAGAGCGIISAILATPTELIKIRQQSLQTPSTARQIAWQILRESGIRGLYRGMTATALRDVGYGAYFYAYEATLRYFSPPAWPHGDILQHVEAERATMSWMPMLLAGGAAGIAGWIFTFPFDVVKTRIQASKPIYSNHPGLPHHHSSASAHSMPSRGYATATGSITTPLLHRVISRPQVIATPMRDTNPYRTTWTTIVNSYKAEGAGVFFRGLSPTLIRAIPVNMVTFATFEAVVTALS